MGVVLCQQFHLMGHDLCPVMVLLPGVPGSFHQRQAQIQRPEEAPDCHLR